MRPRVPEDLREEVLLTADELTDMPAERVKFRDHLRLILDELDDLRGVRDELEGAKRELRQLRQLNGAVVSTVDGQRITDRREKTDGPGRGLGTQRDGV